MWNTSTYMQVDTPGKKLLVGVAVTYVLTVLLVPTANIFIQVGCRGTVILLHGDPNHLKP